MTGSGYFEDSIKIEILPYLASIMSEIHNKYMYLSLYHQWATVLCNIVLSILRAVKLHVRVLKIVRILKIRSQLILWTMLLCISYTSDYDALLQDWVTLCQRLTSVLHRCFLKQCFPWWSQRSRKSWLQLLRGNQLFCLELRHRYTCYELDLRSYVHTCTYIRPSPLCLSIKIL